MEDRVIGYDIDYYIRKDLNKAFCIFNSIIDNNGGYTSNNIEDNLIKLEGLRNDIVEMYDFYNGENTRRALSLIEMITRELTLFIMCKKLKSKGDKINER